MPAAEAPHQAPTVEQPPHPLHALTTSELTGYRRQLGQAIAWFDRQAPVPAVRADLQAALDDVIAEQDDRGQDRPCLTPAARPTSAP
jgi:hypothetical protein